MALDENSTSANPDWSISYSYLFNSTLYLFGQYFCWVHMLQQELSFELFRSHLEKDESFAAIRKVSDAIGNFPPPVSGIGNDAPVFRLQQRAIGEVLAATRDGSRSCLGYSEFVDKKLDLQFYSVFELLQNLIDQVKPGERRWNRLQTVYDAPSELEEHCRKLLRHPSRASSN